MGDFPGPLLHSDDVVGQREVRLTRVSAWRSWGYNGGTRFRDPEKSPKSAINWIRVHWFEDQCGQDADWTAETHACHSRRGGGCALCGGPLDWPKRVADLALLKICPACFAKQRDDPGDEPDG